MKLEFKYGFDNSIDKKNIVHTNVKFAEKSLGEKLMYSNEFRVQVVQYTKKSVSIDIIVDGVEYHIRQLEMLSYGGKYRCVGDDKRGYYFKMDKHQTMPDLCEVIFRTVYRATDGLDKIYQCHIVFSDIDTAEVCGMPVDKYVPMLATLGTHEEKDGQD